MPRGQYSESSRAPDTQAAVSLKTIPQFAARLKQCPFKTDSNYSTAGTRKSAAHGNNSSKCGVYLCRMRTILCDEGGTMRLGLRWLAAVCVMAGVPAGLWAQCEQNCPERRTISVNGTGTVTADADMAVVRVGYKLYGPDAKTAYASALDASNAIMQALTGSGVEKSAIESTSQVIQPTQPFELQQYPFSNEERRQRLFTVTQSWSIRVKPDDAAKVLNTAINAGANESGWIQWMVNDPDALEAQADAKAFASARQAAEQIAATSGVHLEHLVSVMKSDNGFFYNGPIAGAVMGGLGMGTALDTLQVDNRQLAINSRKVEFRAAVQAVFAIE